MALEPGLGRRMRRLRGEPARRELRARTAGR
jgi:hypothetical protein